MEIVVHFRRPFSKFIAFCHVSSRYDSTSFVQERPRNQICRKATIAREADRYHLGRYPSGSFRASGNTSGAHTTLARFRGTFSQVQTQIMSCVGILCVWSKTCHCMTCLVSDFCLLTPFQHLPLTYPPVTVSWSIPEDP